MNGYPDSGLLPAGLRDDLPPLAGFEAEISATLMRRFASYGYEPVKPPLVEFEETLLTGPGKAVAASMFRLMDPISQRMMGVRPDMTLQVARIAATRLAGAPRPARLAYAGRVLRVRASQLRPEREFGQVGVELVGAPPVAGNAELIVLAAEALGEVGVADLSIDMTLPNLVPAVCEGLGLDAATAEAARHALDRKDAAALADLGITKDSLLSALLAAAGPAAEVFSRLDRLDLPAPAAALWAELAEVVELASVAVPGVGITIDPAEFRGFEYHTGLSFTLFAKGIRGELGRGGRYLLESGERAAGFTLYLDSLLRAAAPREPAALLYLPFGTERTAGARLRGKGWRTLHGLEAGGVGGDAAEARRLGCSHLLRDGAIEPLD